MKKDLKRKKNIEKKKKCILKKNRIPPYTRNRNNRKFCDKILSQDFTWFVVINYRPPRQSFRR